MRYLVYKDILAFNVTILLGIQRKNKDITLLVNTANGVEPRSFTFDSELEAIDLVETFLKLKYLK